MKRLLFALLFLVGITVQAANPSYNTSTGVVSPTQTLKLDAAELKVMGVNVLTSASLEYLWTNISGTITANSQVADGASAVAFRMNSSNTLANDAAIHSAFQNHGTNILFITPWGGLIQESPAIQAIDGNPTSVNTIKIIRANDFDGTTSTSASSEIINNPTDYDKGSSWSLDNFFGADSTTSRLLVSSYPTNTVWAMVSGGGTAGQNTKLELTRDSSSVFKVDYLGNVTANNINIPGDQTALNLTVTNELVVKGGAKFAELTVTNNITLYNNTYTSNFFSTTIYASNSISINGNNVATYAGITNTITFALSDMTTALTTGTNKNYWYAPAAGMTVKWVRATLATASSSGTPTFDINEAGTSILSTKITVDANEWDSDTAATPPVISDATIAARAKVDFDIDVTGTAAAGAQIQIGYTVP